MGKDSNIEWTDHTWNPLLGCDKCSEGCKFCYAIRTAWRLQHNPNPTIAAAYAGLVEQRPDGSLNWTGKINLLHERLQQPMRWTKPARIFVNSQSDLFHDAVPDAFIDQVFVAMAACPRHTFQVLTKRAERMRDYLSDPDRLEKIYAQWAGVSGTSPEAEAWPLPNVWIGVSVENQKAADERIPELLATPARVRFLSCEPLLGPVDLTAIGSFCGEPLSVLEECVGNVERPAVDWVIAGGESGPNARPMHPNWARALRDQCAAAGVPFHFKQWGEWASEDDLDFNPADEGAPRHQWTGPMLRGVELVSMRPTVYRVGKKEAGRELDGMEHNGFPAVADGRAA